MLLDAQTLFDCVAERIGSQRLDSRRHFGGDLGPPLALGRRQKVHLEPLAPEPDLIEQPLDKDYSPFSRHITFQVMTGTLESAGNQYPIHPPLECL